jgi:hypothetical protein
MLRGLQIAIGAIACALLFTLPTLAQAESCPTTRASLSAALPDCRAYEQVSPAIKGGVETIAVAAADDGETVLFQARDAFTGSSGGEFAPLFRARRTAAGWQTTSALPPASVYAAPVAFDFTPDLSSYFDTMSADPNFFANGAHSFDEDGFIVRPDDSAVSVTPPGAPSIASNNTTFGIIPDGASADLSHLLLEGTPGLVAGDPTSTPFVGPHDEHDLVEDVGAGSASPRYRMVGVSGPTDANGLGEPVSTCATFLGSGDAETGFYSGGWSVFHAISADGGTIFFTAPSCFSFGAGGFEVKPSVNELLARVGGNGAVQSTVAISEPAVDSCRGVGAFPPGCADATFQGASADGSRVYFTTTQPDEVPGNTDATNNLYLAKLSGTGVQEKVQVSAADTSGEGARVQGVVRISDDGSHVYFVAQGVLSATPNSQGQSAQSGANNLYGYDADTGRLSYIAELCSGAERSGSVADPQCVSPSGDNALFGNDNGRPAQSTPDGRFLIFDSYAQLTPDDTDSAQDVYQYDSQTGALSRLSAGNDGYGANGNDSSYPATIKAPLFDGASHADVHETTLSDVAQKPNSGRSLSDDGAFVFFTTSEALQSNDTNNAPDVYEWHAGQVSLISDGHNPDTDTEVGQGTKFMNTSSSGHDVFFQTTTVLDPAGADGAYNIYDARIDGGFPTSAAAPKCQGDACQGASSPAPAASAPNSATYQGAGNLPPAGASAETTAPAKRKPPTAAQLRASRLKVALKKCKRDRSAPKRKHCESTARKKYGPLKKTKK